MGKFDIDWSDDEDDEDDELDKFRLEDEDSSMGNSEDEMSDARARRHEEGALNDEIHKLTSYLEKMSEMVKSRQLQSELSLIHSKLQEKVDKERREQSQEIGNVLEKLHQNKSHLSSVANKNQLFRNNWEEFIQILRMSLEEADALTIGRPEKLDELEELESDGLF